MAVARLMAVRRRARLVWGGYDRIEALGAVAALACFCSDQYGTRLQSCKSARNRYYQGKYRSYMYQKLEIVFV